MDSSLNFTLDSNNLPIIKLLGNEILGLGDLGMLLKSGSLYFPTENSLTNNERTGAYIRSGNNQMIFGMANEDVVYITSDNKVGIGTADPSYNLHVYVPSSLDGKGGLRLSCGNYSSFYLKHWSTTSTGDRNTGNGMQFFSGVDTISWKIGGSYRMFLKYFPRDPTYYRQDRSDNNQYDTCLLSMGTSTARCPLDLSTYNVGSLNTSGAIGSSWSRIFGDEGIASSNFGGVGEGGGGNNFNITNRSFNSGYVTLKANGAVICQK